MNGYRISSSLEAGVASERPYLLASNSRLGFQGTKVYSTGFVMSAEEAADHLRQYPSERVVLSRYLDGEDVNSTPDQSPSRFVVNFRDWTLEEASRYPGALRIVTERVKPERDGSKYDDLRTYWWRHQRIRKELYESIKHFQHVLVGVLHTKFWSVAVLAKDIVYSHALIVYALEGYNYFALLESFIHEAWAREFSGSLETRLRYTPTDCFETFPFPSTKPGLDSVGERYLKHRHQIMLAKGQGLTKTYNRFHDPDETNADIEKLRELHVEMDNAVATAYGWTNLDLAHNFHPTKQGLRYTISEAARREVLARLLKLNHERYAEEVRQGLHEKKRGKQSPSKPAPTRISSEAKSLFD